MIVSEKRVQGSLKVFTMDPVTNTDIFSKATGMLERKSLGYFVKEPHDYVLHYVEI